MLPEPQQGEALRVVRQVYGAKLSRNRVETESGYCLVAARSPRRLL
jgi:hypothetical protein